MIHRLWSTVKIHLGKTVLPAVYKVVINPDKQTDQIMNAQNANLLMNQIKEIGTKYAVKDNEMAESFIMKTRKGIWFYSFVYDKLFILRW